jgi:hypothetical protein
MLGKRCRALWLSGDEEPDALTSSAHMTTIHHAETCPRAPQPQGENGWWR